MGIFYQWPFFKYRKQNCSNRNNLSYPITVIYLYDETFSKYSMVQIWHACKNNADLTREGAGVWATGPRPRLLGTQNFGGQIRLHNLSTGVPMVPKHLIKINQTQEYSMKKCQNCIKNQQGGQRTDIYQCRTLLKKSSIYFLGAQKKYLPDFSLGGPDYESGLEVGQDFLTQPNPTHYHFLFF